MIMLVLVTGCLPLLSCKAAQCKADSSRWEFQTRIQSSKSLRGEEGPQLIHFSTLKTFNHNRIIVIRNVDVMIFWDLHYGCLICWDEFNAVDACVLQEIRTACVKVISACQMWVKVWLKRYWRILAKFTPYFSPYPPCLASVSSTAITCTCWLDIRTNCLTYILGWFDSFPIQTFLWFPFCVRWWQVSWNQCFQFLPKTNCTISSSHCPKSAPGENRECPKFITKCLAISVTWLVIIKLLGKEGKNC